MAENSEDFRVLLDTAFDVNKIKSQLNNIKGLTVKVDVDASGIKRSMQKAIQEASKGTPNVNIGVNTSSGSSSSRASNTAAQIERINKSLNTGAYDVKLAQLQSGFQKIGLSAQETANKMAKVRSAYVALQSASLENLIAAQKRFNTELLTTQNELSIAKIQAGEYISVLQQVKLSNKIQTWLNNNTAATKEAKLEMQSYLSMLSSGNLITPAQYKEINTAIDTLTTGQRIMGRLGNSFGTAVKAGVSRFSSWIGASTIVMRTITEIRKGIRTVEDLDDALTNINYTMDVSSDKLKNIGTSAVKASKDLHTSLSTVMDAVKTYANANETAESIIEKSKPTIMLSNVSGMGVENTVDILQGTMEQFDLAEDKLMHISDVMQTVSASMPYDFAKGIKELSEGIQASGNVAKDAGYDLEHYTALLGTLIAKTRQSGSELGRSLRTMFVRTTKASSAALAGGEVTEDDLSNAEAALGRVGIKVRSDLETFRSFDEIMSDLYEKVDSLSEVDLSNIAYEVASTRQTNVFKMMIKAYGDYQDMAEKAANADGITLANQEKYVKSIKGHLGELKAISESFWNNMLNSDALKFGIDSLTTILKLLDGISKTFGSLGTIGIGAGIFAGAKNFGGGKKFPLLNMPTI